METNKFNADMVKLHKLLMGFQVELRDSLFGLYNYKNDEFEHDENTFFYFLYDIVNWDLIVITKKAVNIKDSNHPDIAKIIKKYASEENIAKVYERIYIRN